MPKYRKETDSHGVIRYKKKPIMRWLANNVDLNKMWIAYYEGEFSKKEFKQFYRDMGYSESGYSEVWDDK
jgi:hypothetical protein